MIIKIVFIGICVCILNLMLRQYKSAFTVIVNAIFAISVIILIFDSAADAVNTLKDLLNITSSSGKMITCLYKCAAVCILSKLATDICKESGNSSVGDIIDFAGRIMLLIMAMPFIETIIKTAGAFVK